MDGVDKCRCLRTAAGEKEIEDVRDKWGAASLEGEESAARGVESAATGAEASEEEVEAVVEEDVDASEAVITEALVVAGVTTEEEIEAGVDARGDELERDEMMLWTKWATVSCGCEREMNNTMRFAVWRTSRGWG